MHLLIIIQVIETARLWARKEGLQRSFLWCNSSDFRKELGCQTRLWVKRTGERNLRQVGLTIKTILQAPSWNGTQNDSPLFCFFTFISYSHRLDDQVLPAEFRQVRSFVFLRSTKGGIKCPLSVWSGKRASVVKASSARYHRYKLAVKFDLVMIWKEKHREQTTFVSKD